MNQHKLDIIGTTELIGFPEMDVHGVPAKVDTGADSCSVWASDVRVESDGRLSYVLFGPGSRHYTGKRQFTAQYQTRSVKNSFGVSEFRYKVRLQVSLGRRKIRTWFTFADRSSMRFPVLLGRRLLRNKFVVDVSKSLVHDAGQQKRSVLVLVHEILPDHETFFGGLSEFLPEECEVALRTFDQLMFWISPARVEVREMATQQDIASFDLVYFKSHKLDYAFAVTAAEYLRFNHVPFFDEELRDYISYDKLSECMRLRLQGLPVPATFCASRAVLANSAQPVVNTIGAPYVCKDIHGERGHDNYLLQTAQDLQSVLEDAGEGQQFILQQYIPNDGFIRALVLDPEVALIIKRDAVGHIDPRKAHLNKPRGSANAHLIPQKDIPPTVYELSLRAAKHLNRQVAGVDLVQDKKDGSWYILEVNYAPQLMTGAFVDAKKRAFAKFIEFQITG